jgi:hypothetical protein
MWFHGVTRCFPVRVGEPGIVSGKAIRPIYNLSGILCHRGIGFGYGYQARPNVRYRR